VDHGNVSSKDISRLCESLEYLAVGSSLEQHVEPGVGRTFLPIQWEKNKHKEYKNKAAWFIVNTI
jgi:hypothetical protein